MPTIRAIINDESVDDKFKDKKKKFSKVDNQKVAMKLIKEQ